MSSKNKADAEKFQHQLLELLKDEPNRMCADCRARGPRWASWNLGVFICIRCAGMHRNLGVHIAKVKSVNLDTWTQEQVDNMLAWGNAVANEFYEYKLPSDFRRPSDDSGVEKFIRNKYDKKLYIHENFDYANSIKNHPGSGSSVGSKAKPSKVVPAAVNAPVKSIPVVPLKTKSEAYVPPKAPARKPAAPQPPPPDPPSLLQVSLSTTPAPATSVKSDLVDIFGDMVSAAPAPQPAAPPTSAAAPPAGNLLQEVKEESKQSFKDSIMSLYATAPQSGFGQPAQQFGAVSQANGQFGAMPANGQFGVQNTGQYMMPQQNAQFGTQQQPQQFRQQFAQPNMMGMQQQPQQFNSSAQMFGANQQFGQPNGQQFSQFNQQGSNSFGVQNGMGMNNTMQGVQMKNMQGMNMQGMQMNGMQGMNNVQGMNTMQGMNMQGMYMGMGQQQYGYNMGQVSQANQQQQFESVQRQLQQLKVGQAQQSQPQAGWAQAFGSG